MAVPADWDFSHTIWILDVSRYVSAPSSIRFQARGHNSGGVCALCKKADSLDLPQGRIVTYIRLSTRGLPTVHFRNQSPDGTASPQNTYFFCGTPGMGYFYRYVAGAGTTLDGWGMPWLTANSWHLIRVSWWLAYDTQNVASLVMRLERYVAGAWNIERTYYDPDNLWETSGVNRCGVGCKYRTSSDYAWHDNTEIWKPEE